MDPVQFCARYLHEGLHYVALAYGQLNYQLEAVDDDIEVAEAELDENGMPVEPLNDDDIEVDEAELDENDIPPPPAEGDEAEEDGAPVVPPMKPLYLRAEFDSCNFKADLFNACTVVMVVAPLFAIYATISVALTIGACAYFIRHVTEVSFDQKYSSKMDPDLASNEARKPEPLYSYRSVVIFYNTLPLPQERLG